MNVMLAGDDAIAYDLLNTRTCNGQPSTSNDIRELLETTSQGRGSWGITKINRLLKKLERGAGHARRASGPTRNMGVRPSLLWWTRTGGDSPPSSAQADRFADLRG